MILRIYSMFPDKPFLIGKTEFPIVKDTTPNMMTLRLYTTSYKKERTAI